MWLSVRNTKEDQFLSHVYIVSPAQYLCQLISVGYSSYVIYYNKVANNFL